MRQLRGREQYTAAAPVTIDICPNVIITLPRAGSSCKALKVFIFMFQFRNCPDDYKVASSLEAAVRLKLF